MKHINPCVFVYHISRSSARDDSLKGMPSRWQYLQTFTVGMTSLLAGASVVHTVYNPSTKLPIETRLLIAKAEAREAK